MKLAARSGSTTPTSRDISRPIALITRTRRPRKLLLNKREIRRLTNAVNREGMAVVPLKIYFNDRGRAKIEVALAKGKKLYDKRQTEKERSWSREKSRIMKEKG